MEERSKAETWQDLLAELIVDINERERIAAALAVQPVTLTRWAKNISRPREQNILKLLRAIPSSFYSQFLRLVLVEFPHIIPAGPLKPSVSEMLPAEFYAQIFQAYTKLPPLLSHQTIQDLFFQQAIAHLDPERRGMYISLATCVRPLEGQIVRSLREIGGIGTPPWKRDLEHKTILLGAESLAGYALSQFRPIVVPSRGDTMRAPAHWTEFEQSAVAIPIARHTRVCGCLLAASAVPNYFQEEEIAVLTLEHYANLASLLFEERDFYDLDTIHLSFMPPYEIQAPAFREVRQRVLQRFRLAQVRGEQCTLEQARHQVWREIEEELISAFTHMTHIP